MKDNRGEFGFTQVWVVGGKWDARDWYGVAVGSWELGVGSSGSRLGRPAGETMGRHLYISTHIQTHTITTHVFSEAINYPNTSLDIHLQDHNPRRQQTKSNITPPKNPRTQA